jgi:DNA-binding MarR family transcriptional regulator
MIDLMDADARNELSKAVVHMVFGLTGRLRAHVDAAAAEMDLTPMQARALFVLQTPAPMRDLADALHCDASNVTGIVDRLEERALVERQVDPDDRRRRRLVVTEAGHALTTRLRDRVMADHPLLALDDADLVTLHGLLERVEGPCPCPAH